MVVGLTALRPPMPDRWAEKKRCFVGKIGGNNEKNSAASELSIEGVAPAGTCGGMADFVRIITSSAKLVTLPSRCQAPAATVDEEVSAVP